MISCRSASWGGACGLSGRAEEASVGVVRFIAAISTVAMVGIQSSATIGRHARFAAVVSGTGYESEPWELSARGASTHWPRLLRSLGHEARSVAAQRVKPYLKRGKNEAVDAEAPREA